MRAATVDRHWKRCGKLAEHATTDRLHLPKNQATRFGGFFLGATMAGTIPLSLTQQFDEFGKPLSGGLLYIYQAGTVATPQQPYQDAGLSIVQPNPIVLDAAGRVPQFFLADGYIKVRLDNKSGVTQLARDNVLVIGPSAGGGGGGASVDPTTILQTGMLSIFYGTGVVGGFVRANGRTIGSATSGASERANSDCNALFQFLWNADPNLAVSGGRGASSAADWAANKTITLPDWRGRTIAGLDDMGNVAAGRLSTTYFGSSPIVLGNAGGGENKTLVTANLPPYTPGGNIAVVNGAITITNQSNLRVVSGDNNNNGGGGGSFSAMASSVPPSLGASQAASSATFTGTAQGGVSTPVSAVQPTMLCTIYLKL